MAAIFEPLFTKLRATTYQSQHLSSAKAKTETFGEILKDWDHGQKNKSSNNLRQKAQVWASNQVKTFCEIHSWSVTTVTAVHTV